MFTRGVPTYDDALKVGERCERLARNLAYDIRTLYYSTLQPSHTEGEDVDEECGTKLMADLMDQTENLTDWMKTMEERIGDHRKHLSLQEVK